jgi:hypothetical protein
MNFNNVITMYKGCNTYPPVHNKDFYLYKINNSLIHKIDSKSTYLYHISTIVYTGMFVLGIFVYFSILFR